MFFKKNVFCKLFSLFFAVHMAADAALDLDSMVNGIVEETKQIEIPGYPYAFNPAIIEWNNAYLFCFRIRHPATKATNEIGFVWMDKKFNLISKPKKLRWPHKKNILQSMTQDPRLLKCGNELYLICNDTVALPTGAVRRMIVGKLCFNKGSFVIKEEQILLQFEKEKSNKHEKNWVPFEYKNQLLLAATINPHLVFEPIKDTCGCLTYSCSKPIAQWNWGELRGGTPALLDNGEYLAFFHSSKDLITLQSKEKKIIHYFMGAYTFSDSAPFNITKISPEPIVGADFYHAPEYPTWKPLLVVFPCGILIEKEYVYIAYGRQDFECWIAKINKKKLLASMKKVS